MCLFACAGMSVGVYVQASVCLRACVCLCLYVCVDIAECPLDLQLLYQKLEPPTVKSILSLSN